MPPLESFPPGWTLLACDHGYTDIDMAKDSNSVGFVYKHTEYKTKTSGCGNRRACSHVCSATNEFLIPWQLLHAGLSRSNSYEGPQLLEQSALLFSVASQFC